MKDNIKTAFELAEQEVQEKEIANLKLIIKDLLKSKLTKEEEKREIEKEISVIKQTIDDFKSGRLDKVKELIEKDSVAKDTLPFKIVIINQPVITKPWGWNYRVVPNYNGGIASGGLTTINNISSVPATTCSYSSASSAGASGTNYATFTSGTYLVNGRTINL